ncbi:MAG: hypothetical protein BJ554DRAFT_1232, partial [Olpidium bornovanus]
MAQWSMHQPTRATGRWGLPQSFVRHQISTDCQAKPQPISPARTSALAPAASGGTWPTAVRTVRGRRRSICRISTVLRGPATTCPEAVAGSGHHQANSPTEAGRPDLQSSSVPLVFPVAPTPELALAAINGGAAESGVSPDLPAAVQNSQNPVDNALLDFSNFGSEAVNLEYSTLADVLSADVCPPELAPHVGLPAFRSDEWPMCPTGEPVPSQLPRSGIFPEPGSPDQMLVRRARSPLTRQNVYTRVQQPYPYNESFRFLLQYARERWARFPPHHSFHGPSPTLFFAFSRLDDNSTCEFGVLQYEQERNDAGGPSYRAFSPV